MDGRRGNREYVERPGAHEDREQQERHATDDRDGKDSRN